ncbi:glycoside hydrolase family 10 protein [Butyricicoccus pullicaecorum]|uniref:glycoside hydrolase family 10 protein n=1 Tax=Butyricicoccus pullicaecorum TaxID=501571 RepID=UPI003990DD7A
MKRSFRLLALVLACVLTLVTPAFAAGTPSASEEMRGVWVSSVYNLDYPSSPTTDPDKLKAEADEILDNCVKWGLNAVFLQVRPSGDALYKSDLFPWSKYLTGSVGTAPQDGFDPLEYWVEAAHKRGLELHAWINPYRITRSKDTEWNSLPSTHPAKMNPDWVVKYSDGNYYFNPGIPEVRDLVTRGAVEIVQNYDVDGLHMDDYFYPGTDFNDAATYQKYGSSFSNIADFRRDSVNQLVAQLDTAVHNIDPNIQFGISPSGIWANKSTDPRGSNTNGSEHYVSSYADSLYWIENGLVDYIIPQIYWEIGHKLADFATLADWWNDAVAGSDVHLYIGMGAYRCADNPTGVWTTTDPLFDSLAYLENKDNVGGCVFFRYGSIPAVSGMADRLTSWYSTVHNENTAPNPSNPGGSSSSSLNGGNFGSILSQFLLSMIQ